MAFYNMTIEIEHTLSRQEAKNRIERLIEHYQEEYKAELQDLAVNWNEDIAHIRLKARGYSTAGTLEIKDKVVRLDFYMPFLLQVFSKKITSTIQERIRQSLA
jgi:putative polyhydroxyalkanoate system protein